MYKSAFIVCLHFIFSGEIYCQTNLVLNGSFETYSVCPSGQGQVPYALNWFISSDSPDYYNSCASVSCNFSTPIYGNGFQIPFDGNAYCGLEAYYKTTNLRTCISSKLLTSLTMGQKYFVSMKVNLADNPNAANYGINKIGALFSTQKYTPSSPPPVNNFSQIYTNTIIADSINWSTIKGSFIADSIYQYINISNFFDNNNTDTLKNPNSANLGSMFSYYLFDDIRVSTDSLFGLGYVGINEIEEQNIHVKLYPNPGTDEIFVEVNGFVNCDLVIYNLLGQQVVMQKLEGKTSIDVSKLNAGTYIYKIKQGENQLKVDKLIINR